MAAGQDVLGLPPLSSYTPSMLAANPNLLASLMAAAGGPFSTMGPGPIGSDGAMMMMPPGFMPKGELLQFMSSVGRHVSAMLYVLQALCAAGLLMLGSLNLEYADFLIHVGLHLAVINPIYHASLP